MPVLGLYVVALIGVALVLTGSLRRRLIAFLVFTLLVPHALVLPSTTTWLPVDRLVLIAFAVGIGFLVRDGEVPWSALRPTRVQAAFMILLIVAFVNGVSLNQTGVKLTGSLFAFTVLFEQFLVLTVTLAVARVLGPRKVIEAVVGVFLVLVLIALTERVFSYSYHHWWFDHVSNLSPVQSRNLETRGGTIRIRGAAQFALEFGWMCAMALGIVIATTIGRRRWAWSAVAAALVGLGLLLSISRSPILGVAIAAVVLLLGGRFDRRVSLLLIVGIAAGGIYFFATPNLRNSLAAAQKTDSVESRDRRRIELAGEVASHPYTGLGLAGTQSFGFQGTDNSYLLTYVSLGMPGLVTLLVTLLVALVTAGSLLWREKQADVLLGAGLTAGIACGIIAGGAYDIFTTPASSSLLWILVGVAAAAAGAASALPTRRPRRERLIVFPLVGAGIGLLVLTFAPRHTAVRFRFDAIPTALLYRASGNPSFVGGVLINTDCGLIRTRLQGTQHATVKCQDLKSGPGVGEVRIEGRTTADVRAVVAQLGGIAADHGLGGYVRGTPTWARTAPIAGAMAGAEAALLLPPLPISRLRRRRRIDGAPDEPEPTRAYSVL